MGRCQAGGKQQEEAGFCPLSRGPFPEAERRAAPALDSPRPPERVLESARLGGAGRGGAGPGCAGHAHPGVFKRWGLSVVLRSRTRGAVPGFWSCSRRCVVLPPTRVSSASTYPPEWGRRGGRGQVPTASRAPRHVLQAVPHLRSPQPDPRLTSPPPFSSPLLRGAPTPLPRTCPAPRSCPALSWDPGP